MGSSKLTDEELIELAKQVEIDNDEDRYDVKYYQERFMIIDGTYRVYFIHLYNHYKKWSVDPIGLESFKDMIQLNRKSDKHCYLDREMCNLNLDKLLGEYVKEKRQAEKEKRLRQVSSFKPKT